MKRVVGGVAMSLMLIGQPAWAQRLPVHDAAESSEYGRKAGGMLGRGVLNVATSFVDLPVAIVNETHGGPPLVGTLVGLGKGLGCTTLRALSGGLDILTFWVPGFNGMPVSDTYGNCLEASAGQASGEQGLAPAGGTWQEPAMGTAGHGASMTAPKEEKPRYSK